MLHWYRTSGAPEVWAKKSTHRNFLFEHGRSKNARLFSTQLQYQCGKDKGESRLVLKYSHCSRAGEERPLAADRLRSSAESKI